MLPRKEEVIVTRQILEAALLQDGRPLCIRMSDGARFLGFFVRLTDTHLVVRQGDKGQLPGFLQLPYDEIEEVTGIVLIRLGYDIA